MRHRHQIRNRRAADQCGERKDQVGIGRKLEGGVQTLAVAVHILTPEAIGCGIGLCQQVGMPLRHMPEPAGSAGHVAVGSDVHRLHRATFAGRQLGIHYHHRVCGRVHPHRQCRRCDEHPDLPRTEPTLHGFSLNPL